MTYPPETNQGSVTSWVPLTTPFPMPASCSSYFRLDGPSLMAFDPAYGIDVNTDATCEPKPVTSWWENTAGYALSIGPLTCPEGWKTQQTYRKGQSSTQVMCCPVDYYLANTNPDSTEVNGDCLSNVSSGQILTYGSTPAGGSHFVHATTTIFSVSTVGAIAVVGWNIGNAAPVSQSIAGSSNNGPAASTSASSVSSTASSGQTGPTRSTGTSSKSTGTALRSGTLGSALGTTTSSPDQTSSGGLSTGAKAGIGVGVSVGAIGIIALIVAILLLLRRKKESDKKEHHPDASHNTQEPKHGPQVASNQPWERGELDGRPYYESPVNYHVAELSGTPKIREARSPVELYDSRGSFRR